VGDGNSLIAVISNVDEDSDETLPVDHPLIIYRSGNEMWYTNSSFREIPAMTPMLSDDRSKKGRAYMKELVARATGPEDIQTHEWDAHDLII